MFHRLREQARSHTDFQRQQKYFSRLNSLVKRSKSSLTRPFHAMPLSKTPFFSKFYLAR
jgi:hypothetical protein